MTSHNRAVTSFVDNHFVGGERMETNKKCCKSGWTMWFMNYPLGILLFPLMSITDEIHQKWSKVFFAKNEPFPPLSGTVLWWWWIGSINLLILITFSSPICDLEKLIIFCFNDFTNQWFYPEIIFQRTSMVF